MAEQASGQPPTFSQEWRPESTLEQDEASSTYRPARAAYRWNWPLWVGGFIVTLIFLVAIIGPALAPQDPIAEHTIIQTDEKWETPPFPPFTVPGFPLGSDQFGRDVLSRLLWGVRPTLVMVVIVAAVRLVLGIAIGMGAGWSTGRFGHALDAAIGAALSVPVLIVALAAIALIGVELGLLAFIIGLAITGWVETARYVREQTHIIKSNLYVEAARALGASDASILVRHVLRQIMPMVWMLFSFEISSTLMTTAGLGFLGYYIGGEVWIDVDDFVARRLSGMPELGQMLASAWSEQQVITEPWGMIIAGSTIFIAILGFTLLGEGLRLRLGLDRAHRRTVFSIVGERIRLWAEQKGLGSVARRRQAEPGVLRWTGALRFVAAGTIIILACAAFVWWRAQTEEQASAEESALGTNGPTGHLWAAERRDAHGTLWSDTTGPSRPGIQWVFQDPTGFAGGPAVSEDGTLYIASKGGALYAMDASANILWEATLPAGGLGTPALGADGTIYVTDQEGGLSAVSPAGETEWHYQSGSTGKATTGPVIAADGTVYYPGGGKILAVSSSGALLWEARAPYGFNPLPPQLSPSNSMLFFLDSAYNTQDGSLFDMSALLGNASNEQYIVGADGETYYRSEGRIIHWSFTPSGVEALQGLTRHVPGHARDAGATPDGVMWATYGGGYNSPDTGIVWLNWDDEVLGNIEYQQDPSWIIGVGMDAVIYTCGNTEDETVECIAAEPGADDLLWQITLTQADSAAGGALVPGRLYVALESGSLYAISDVSAEDQATTADAQPTIIHADPPQATSTPTLEPIADASSRGKAATATPQPTHTPEEPPAEPALLGDTLTYTLHVVNNGPSGATRVVVTDTLPASVTLISATSSQGNGCENSDDTLICQLGDMANQASATITLVVRIDTALAESITNTATVTSDIPDPDLLDNQMDQQTRIVAGADLAIHQLDDPDPAIAGQPLTYTLSITNTGPGDATGVMLTSTLPISATFVSAAANQGPTCAETDGTLHCQLADLLNGASYTVTIVVDVNPSAIGVILHSATVVANEPDWNPSNNSVDEETSINSAADLSITP